QEPAPEVEIPILEDDEEMDVEADADTLLDELQPTEEVNLEAELSAEEELQSDAVEEVLDKAENAEELAPALKQVKAEDIHEAVEEAIEEVAKDDQNAEINAIIDESLTEMDEGAIEESVAEVLNSSEESVTEKADTEENVAETENVDEVPDSVTQIVEESGIDETEAVAEVPEAETATEADAEEALENLEAELQPMENPKLKMVKMSELDDALKIPEDADFDGLVAFIASLEQVRPSDLDAENPEIQEKQVNEFIQKLLETRIATAEKMLTLENLTEDQWETAVSLKVQTLAMLFRMDPIYVEKLREFTTEIADRASADLFWNVEAVLIQMELCQFETEPEPEILKQHVAQMLTHTKKGIELKCLNADFALAAVQMVLLTEDKLPKTDSEPIFAEAIEILNSSDSQQLKDTAKLLENIQKQQRMKGQTIDLTLTTHDGKTIKTTDYVGKTLLLYCFSLDSQESVQDLGLIYQLYMAYNARGLEVVSLVSAKKVPEMDELLKQIPWPMVFVEPKNADVENMDTDSTDAENADEEESPFEKLAISMFPCKVLINTMGVVENPNADPMALMKYLQAIYGAPMEEAEDEADTEVNVEDVEDSVELEANAETEAEVNVEEAAEAENVELDVLELDTDTVETENAEAVETQDALELDAEAVEVEDVLESEMDAVETEETEAAELELDELDLDTETEEAPEEVENAEEVEEIEEVKDTEKVDDTEDEFDLGDLEL
ncbi:MAG: hypothetical protein Q4C70_11775, partial [Planctomycetia bacterium]|nr:hypothetical protein [Planctomycetia bacterium]